MVAEQMGAEILGNGTHRLYGSSHTGMAFKFPKWYYPVVIDKEGNIFYDNYNGAWGNSADIEKFQEMYATEVIRAECGRLGWYCEPVGNGDLIVHHPSGGTITVERGGTIDAANFVGTSCQEATAVFEEALGTRLGQGFKPYLNEIQIQSTE